MTAFAPLVLYRAVESDSVSVIACTSPHFSLYALVFISAHVQLRGRSIHSEYYGTIRLRWEEPVCSSYTRLRCWLLKARILDSMQSEERRATHTNSSAAAAVAQRQSAV
jgi:hypothetical protein